MSDSFADLWNSTTPAQPQKSIPLSQQKPATPSYSQPKPKHDVFSLLSQSSTAPTRGGSLGPSSSRPGSSLAASSSSSRPLTPSMSSSGTATSRPSSGASKSSGDAFNDLFAGSLGGGTKSTANMTIAERAAMVEKQRLASQSKSPAAPAVQNSHQWSGLDALGGGPMAPTASRSRNVVVDDNDDWGLGDFAAPVTAKPKTQAPAKKDSLLDFGDFDSGPSTARAPSQSPPAQQTKSGSLWDLDEFTSGSSSTAHTQSNGQEKFDSPDFDFDFGNREDASNGRSHHGDDDILGDLSKPVEAIRAQSTAASSNTSTATSRRQTPQVLRTSSPPPHILGQIVEMGFSLQQAKSALAKTESGTDVQAALNMLLGDDGNATPPTSTRAGDSAPSDHSPPPQRRFQYSDDEDDEYAAAAARRRRQQQQAQRQNAGASGEGKATPNLQAQADEILAQASEIGLNVFNKASLFWKQGKEKVQKAYEERAGVASGSNDQGFPPPRTGSRDSRPKWMQDVAAHTEQSDDVPKATRSEFRDSDDGGSAFKDDDHPPPQRAQRAGPSSRAPPPRPAPQPQPEVDLFSSAPSEPSEPKAYVSPWRRKKVTADATPPPSAAAPRRPSPAAAPPKPKRRLPTCPGHKLDVVRQHKNKGTEAFKLGQYSVAAEEYSKAITLLPGRHLLLVPLYTNRALARIRCGECKGAVEDAGGALDIIAGGGDAWKGWNPSSEEGGWELDGGGHGEPNGGYGVARPKGSEWNDGWGRGVDLKDGWIKAVRRRAEALEGMEKWNEARKDWEVLTGGGWVDGKTREDAVRGLGRCKKMVDGESGATGSGSAAPRPTAAASKPKPKPKPVPAPAVVTSGEAVKAYREQVNAMEAENELKYELKDAVEAKLLAWKKGKETNLRALLASLDTILWEDVIKDMGGKPDMAALISGGGVKKWYMKSVARVHPDKLNANNSTVEQRMIAGGVFGALNEAWLAFKQ